MSLAADGYENEKGRKGSGKKKATPFLDEFGEDLTAQAAEGKLDPIIGRDKEIYRICQILARRKKNNPIILGDPGVGKTAIVEAIAQRIVSKKVARVLLNKRVISINMTTIVAGTKYRGEFEERMKNIVDELKNADNVIVFIDEIHTIVGAGGVSGALDASNILKPALARGQVQCIGATTLDEYRENIEDDGALTRRFQEVFIDPPSIKDTIEILNRIKDNYEEHHSVEYSQEALEACVKLSERYIKQRELPDKAIDLLDESGARTHLMEVKMPVKIKDLERDSEKIRLEKKLAVEKQDYELAARLRDEQLKIESKVITETEAWEKSLKLKRRKVTLTDILETISMQTGIPVNKLGADDLKMIKDMPKVLKENIIGQDSAVDALSQVIKRSRTNVASHNKPIGSFMFLGPTGVGKTETVKALAEYMFGEPESMIRIDMSEYQEKFNVSRLIGSPPGYVGHEDGGQLTEAVRRKPYSVVLFDEIEKAHPDTFNTLLQVLDEGRLTDSLGREIDFTNTIIVMTSNVGARKVQDFGSGIGFSSKSTIAEESKKMDSIIKKELKNKFSPEFLNRLDQIILFNQLSHDNILKIVDIELNKFNERMEEEGYTFKFTKTAKEFLAVEGYDPAYGARPVKRAISKYVEDLIADAILDEKLKQGKTYTINKVKTNSKLTLR
jgi:ATP-dependent Clp protease ATP-binding subunit ClpC|tara:strand:+ start:2628 stop:4643 length:2016 start_codon:yes stop_codon:yes gene_type:complete